MTRDEITRMAREAGLHPYYDAQSKAIERFAALVAEAEREACRRACKTLADAAQEEAYYRGHMECEAAIRARGEV